MVVRSILFAVLVVVLACGGETPPPTAPDFAKGGKAALTVTSLLDDGSAGTLRSVIAAAPSGSKVTFANTLCVSGGRCTITLSSTLGIANNLTISGPLSYTLAVDGGNTVQVISIGGADTVAIKNLTISGGKATLFGGGISNDAQNSVLTLTNDTISGNTAGESGGGIDNGATLTLTNSVVRGNSAPLGGGIFTEGSLTAMNTVVSGNIATQTFGGFGGGIFAAGGSVTLTNSLVSGNTAAFSGGGILHDVSGVVTLTNDTISGNNAGFGGGIFNSKPTSITGSMVSGNTASAGGGGIINTDTLTVASSTISGNTAGDNSHVGNGGGLLNRSGIATLVNDTVSANNASSGDTGGIVAQSGTIALQKQTCVNNNLSGGTASAVPWSPINVAFSGTVTGLNCGVAHP